MGIRFEDWVKIQPDSIIINECQQIVEIFNDDCNIYFLNDRITEVWKNIFGDEIVKGCYSNYTSSWISNQKNLKEYFHSSPLYNSPQIYLSFRSYFSKSSKQDQVFEGLLVLCNGKIIEVNSVVENNKQGIFFNKLFLN